jgi:tellurium resistance protein TerD
MPERVGSNPVAIPRAKERSMTISLAKGGNISLSGADPSLTKVLIGLGWDPRPTNGAEFDLDASAFILNGNGKVRSDADFVFYNQKTSPDGSVEHAGDNRTGQGDGDDEVIRVAFSEVSRDVQKLAITVTIDQADVRRQNFGQVSNAYIRIVNEETGTEIVRYDLSEDYSVETAMVFGELYRHGAGWKFRAVGQGYSGGLMAMCKQYGINAA